jgi:amino acid transporter
MSHSRKAPKLFGKLNRRGVPVAALLATGLVSALAFFSTVVGDQKIYQIFYNASSLSGFLIWLGIAVCHLRFRKAWVAQGRSLDDLKFKSKFYPFGPWLAVILFVVVRSQHRRVPGAGVLLVRLHHRLPDDSGFPALLSGPQVLEQDPGNTPEGVQFRDGLRPDYT